MDKDIINKNTSMIGTSKTGVWFVSDLHLGHKNLVKCLTNWTNTTPCRDFASVEEMNETIIKNINSKVDAEDNLYILGDFAILPLHKWPDLRFMINCKNIHLILGNHDPKKDILRFDKQIKNSVYKPLDLFKSIRHTDEIKIAYGESEIQRISLSHYAHRTWNRAHHGQWCLYGHSHGSMPEYEQTEKRQATVFISEREGVFDSAYIVVDAYIPTGKFFKTMDVGIDTNNFFPYSFEDIQELFKDRVDLGIDHHQE